jgi:hypothetical protein
MIIGRVPTRRSSESVRNAAAEWSSSGAPNIPILIMRQRRLHVTNATSWLRGFPQSAARKQGTARCRATLVCRGRGTGPGRTWGLAEAGIGGARFGIWTEARPAVASLHSWGTSSKRMVTFDGYDGEMRRERFAISGPSGRNSRAPWSECGQRTLWRGVTPVADLALLTTVTSRAEGP